jgi:hypothetical protein
MKQEIAGFTISKKDILSPLRTPIPKERPAIIEIDDRFVWDGCAMLGSLWGGWEYPSEVTADRVLEALRGGIYTADAKVLGPGLILHKRLFSWGIKVLREQIDGKGITVSLPRVQFRKENV